MMRLLRSWRDSLLLLLPQNLKLFALVTIKSTLETYKVLVRNWYLLLIVAVWLFVAFIRLQIDSLEMGFEVASERLLDGFNFISFGSLFWGLAAFISTVYCLAVRPSVKKKNWEYFFDYRCFFVKFICLLLSLWQLYFWLTRDFTSYYFGLTSALTFIQPGTFLLLTRVIPPCIFFILFFLDSDGSIKNLGVALVRAIKMTLYNLPLLVIFMIAFVLPIFMVMRFNVSHQMGYIWYIALLLFDFLIFNPLLINIWTNIYIKKLHEMPDLYFNQPK